MKGGASPTDIKDIAKFLKAGHDVEAVANAMNLTVACVRSFVPENLAKIAKNQKAREAKDAVEHKRKKDIMRHAREEVRDGG